MRKFADIKMKLLLILFFLILGLQIFAQDKIVGHYADYFGHSITINADGNFKYFYHFDMVSFWTKGIWTLQNDTVFLTAIPIYDTLRYMDRDKITKDSLTLAVDEKPQIRSFSITGAIYSGSQDINDYPQKLLFKNNRLYSIDKKGKLITKKEKALWTGKKYRPWFNKTNVAQD